MHGIHNIFIVYLKSFHRFLLLHKEFTVRIVYHIGLMPSFFQLIQLRRAMRSVIHLN